MISQALGLNASDILGCWHLPLAESHSGTDLHRNLWKCKPTSATSLVWAGCWMYPQSLNQLPHWGVMSTQGQLCFAKAEGQTMSAPKGNTIAAVADGLPHRSTLGQ